MNIDETLAEREKTYGSFKKYSHIARELKLIIDENDNGLSILSNDQREALEMIMSKVARILNGDPNYIDNWVDISGYATLIINNLKEEGKE